MRSNSLGIAEVSQPPSAADTGPATGLRPQEEQPLSSSHTRSTVWTAGRANASTIGCLRPVPSTATQPAASGRG